MRYFALLRVSVFKGKQVMTCTHHQQCVVWRAQLVPSLIENAPTQYLQSL